MITAEQAKNPVFTYSPWRHGGWYVHGVRYPSGAIGCVSRNFPDKKWRIVCDPRPFDQQPTFATREAAARAEYALAQEQYAPNPKPVANEPRKVYCLMNYTTQCTDVVSGKTGCFLFDQQHWISTGEFRATSPVFPDLVAFYAWNRESGSPGRAAYVEREVQS